jgi:hypothetical protein
LGAATSLLGDGGMGSMLGSVLGGDTAGGLIGSLLGGCVLSAVEKNKYSLSYKEYLIWLIVALRVMFIKSMAFTLS